MPTWTRSARPIRVVLVAVAVVVELEPLRQECIEQRPLPVEKDRMQTRRVACSYRLAGERCSDRGFEAAELLTQTKIEGARAAEVAFLKEVDEVIHRSEPVPEPQGT
jgi:hypothetical protein